MIIKDSLITIATVNFDSLVDFYRDLLQKSPQVYINQVYAEFYITGIKLGIFKLKSGRKDEFSHPQKSAFSLCLEVEDLEIAIADILEKGYSAANEIIESSHGQEIYIYDPDENRIILHQSRSDRRR